MKALDGRELFGVKLVDGNKLKDDLKNLFLADYDIDDEVVYKFNKEFECDFFGNDKPIKYNFYLHIIDMREYDEEDYRPSVTLTLLPRMDFINKKLIDHILEDYYGDFANILNLRYKDIVDEACPCIIAEQRLDFPKDWKWEENTFDELLETASAVIPMINNLLGFYMDRNDKLGLVARTFGRRL